MNHVNLRIIVVLKISQTMKTKRELNTRLNSYTFNRRIKTLSL